MSLVLASIVTIIIVYGIFALIPVRICAICAAVFLTWSALLVGYMLGWHDDIVLLGILMGGSVVGLSYKMEKYFRTKKLSGYWFVRMGIVAFGFYGVYSILLKNWDSVMITVLVSVVFGFLSLFFVKKKSAKNSNAHSTLRDRLEHCCD